MSDFVTIKSFDTIPEAHLVKHLLDNEQIACTLQDENLSAMNQFYSFASGGIKLKVKKEDAHRAIQILIDAGYLTQKDIKASKAISFLTLFFRKHPSSVTDINKAYRFLKILFIIIIVLAILAAIFRIKNISI